VARSAANRDDVARLGLVNDGTALVIHGLAIGATASERTDVASPGGITWLTAVA
jgi:hypothetical protein